MITFVFGEEKSAMPKPAAASAITIAHTGVCTCVKAKNSRVSAHTAMPLDTSLYAGTRSDMRPIHGEKIAMNTGCVIMISPAACEFSPCATCR